MLSYEIIIHCICGKVEKYILDAYKFPIAIIGRKDDTCEYQHIGLCADDGNRLSRTELYFAYDVNKKDWVVGNGFPNENYWSYDKNIEKLDEKTKNKRINNQVYIFSKDNLGEKLNSEIKSKLKIEKEKIKKDNPYAESFNEIKGNDVFELNTIAGVGIFPVNYEEKEVIFYKGKKHTGTKLILLPEIPFHWYIEVNNYGKNRDVIRNAIEKTNYLSEVYNK